MVEPEFALQLAEMRLLQTWHLLNLSMPAHAEPAALTAALVAITTAREFVNNLVGSLPPKSPGSSGHELPAA